MIKTLCTLLMLVAALTSTNVVGAQTTRNRTEIQAHNHKNGVHYRSGYWQTFVTTKYCLTGRTASGTFTHWGTVASVTLPPGTHLSIPGYSYWATTEDTGYLAGNQLDLWDYSCARAFQWGRRYLRVFVYTSRRW